MVTKRRKQWHNSHGGQNKPPKKTSETQGVSCPAREWENWQQSSDGGTIGAENRPWRRAAAGGVAMAARENNTENKLRITACVLQHFWYSPFTLKRPNFLTTCSHCNDKTNLDQNNSSHFQSGKKIKEKERKNPCGIHGRAHRPGHADPLRRRQRARGKAYGLRRRLGAGGKLHRTRDPWAGIGT